MTDAPYSYRGNSYAVMVKKAHEDAQEKLEGIVGGSGTVSFSGRPPAPMLEELARRESALAKARPKDRYALKSHLRLYREALTSIESRAKDLEEVYTSLGYEKITLLGKKESVDMYARTADGHVDVLADRHFEKNRIEPVLYRFENPALLAAWRGQSSNKMMYWDEFLVKDPSFDGARTFGFYTLSSLGGFMLAGIIFLTTPLDDVSAAWAIKMSVGGLGFSTSLAGMQLVAKTGITYARIRGRMRGVKTIASGHDALYRAAEAPKDLGGIALRYRVEESVSPSPAADDLFKTPVAELSETEIVNSFPRPDFDDAEADVLSIDGDNRMKL